MAKRTRQGGLVGKLGAAGKKGMAAHKSDETTFDTGGDLPAGIEGGVGQLVDCKFDTYKKGDDKGEYFFYIAGIVKQPVEHGGVPIEGLRTSITEPMCDTPGRSRKTIDDHLDWVLNEMRKLGVDTSELGIDGLEDAAAALKEEQPHFRFRTWKGGKQTEGPYKDVEPRVNHVWSGVCDYTEDAEEGDVVDETEDEQEEEAEGSALTSLGEAADEGDETAEASLSEKAEEVGVDPNAFATWAEVATAIEEAPEEEEESEKESEEEPEEEEEEEEEPEEGEEDWAPEKGEVYSYKPPKKRKAIECEVLAVFPRKKTCNLKSLDDSKVYNNVPWDKLEGDE